MNLLLPSVLCTLKFLNGISQAQDYDKLLNAAKFSLSESIEVALKNSKTPRTPLEVSLEERKGKQEFVISGAQEERTFTFWIDIVEGKNNLAAVVKVDQSTLAAAIKIKLSEAIDSAVKETKGKAVKAKFRLNADMKPECVVTVFKDGKTQTAIVDGTSGKITSVKD